MVFVVTCKCSYFVYHDNTARIDMLPPIVLSRKCVKCFVVRLKELRKSFSSFL